MLVGYRLQGGDFGGAKKRMSGTDVMTLVNLVQDHLVTYCYRLVTRVPQMSCGCNTDGERIDEKVTKTCGVMRCGLGTNYNASQVDIPENKSGRNSDV